MRAQRLGLLDAAQRRREHSCGNSGDAPDAPAQKNETLFQHGINFNDLPLWQRRGTGAYFDVVEKVGYDPHRKVKTKYQRRRLKVDEELPMKDQYAAFLKSLLDSAEVNDE